MCQIIVRETCESNEGFALSPGLVIYDVDELDESYEGFGFLSEQLTLLSVNKDFAEKV